MAAELLESHGVEAQLIKGGGGIFKVKAQGQLVFDKAATKRFPEVGELSQLISHGTDEGAR